MIPSTKLDPKRWISIWHLTYGKHSKHDDKLRAIHSFFPFSSPLHSDLRRYDWIGVPIYVARRVTIMDSKGTRN